MKITIDGTSYEVKSENALRGGRSKWRERWIALPKHYFEGKERDQFKKLYLNDFDKIMVVSNQTFEELAEPLLEKEEV